MEKYSRLSENSESRNCVEIGSKVFAIVNIVLTGLACAVACGWFLFFTIRALTTYGNGYTSQMDIIFMSIMVIFVTLSAIIFAFSVILLMGLFQNRPGYVKSYFVFGVIVTLVVLAASVALLLISGLNASDSLFVIGISILSVACCYSAILVMIWAAYKKVLDDKQKKHLAPVEKLNTNTMQTCDYI